MIITNCGITMQDSELLKPCVMSKDDEDYKKLGKFHTGLDIAAMNVFTMYRGRVVYIGSEQSGRTVVVQTGSSFCVCYKRLQTVNVQLNDLLEATCYVGSVDKYVHVEVYLKDISTWPVRLGQETWYKADANLLIYGGLQTLYEYAYKQDYTSDWYDPVDDEAMSEMTDNAEEE